MAVTLAAIAAAACGSGGSKTGSDAAGVGEVTDSRGSETADDQGNRPEDIGSFDFASSDFVPVGCDEPPFGDGCPCDANSECAGDFCIESLDGFVCTSQCIDECPPGWTCKGIAGLGTDIVLVCVPSSGKLCFPCKKDSQCPDGRCAKIDGRDFCATSCASDKDCPASFKCKETAAGDGKASLCIPDSGSCECLVEHAGQLRPCAKSNDLGECFGYEECDPAVGWGECSALLPLPESCNGVDDDCDTDIDEDLETGGPCIVKNDFGMCAGAYACLGPLGQVCQGPEAAAEVCDYKDNDCDQVVDESFTDESGKYVAFDNCGSCGVSCALGFPNAKTKCDTSLGVPKCVVDVCDPGYFKLNEFQCIPNTASLCEPCTKDENCLYEGAFCVQLSDGTFCSKPCSAQADCPDGFGCAPYEGSLQCIPVTSSCTCDGTNLNLTKSCDKTWPDQPQPGEPSITCYGLQFCTPDGWTPCDLPDDVCDGADNDCNGIADDPFVDGQGRYVTDGNCGQCGNNCTAVAYSNADGVCNADKAIPDCMMKCKPGFHDVNGNPADGCECLFTPGPDLTDGNDTDCDGVDGEVGNAVFVAKNGADDNAGDIDHPMLTIQAAIAKAEASGLRDVYVATGVYNGSVVLKPGSNVYGGFSSDFKTRHVLLYETVIMGAAPTASKPGAVTIGSVTDEETTLDGFTIFGFDNDAPEGNTYGIYVRDSGDELHVRNCHVYAGDGGDGANGPSGQDGQDGKDGGGGSPAYIYPSMSCSGAGALKQGGTGGAKTCGSNVGGGDGGDSHCPKANSAPTAGEAGLGGSGPGAGAGGAAGWDAAFSDPFNPCTLCSVPSQTHPMDGSDGGPGADGADGTKGAGCTQASGVVNNGIWQPVDASSGANGTNGGGGGGGGAGAGVDNMISCNEQIGGTGGGGGSGACSGTGGAQGTGGGGSFGVFIFYSVQAPSAPSIEDNFIQAGIGGSGGTGGNGGTGGVGGNGGNGGGEFSDAWCARSGGDGGKGGDGGHGGGGGGGCGGVSYAVYVSGGAGVDFSPLAANNQLVAGSGGPGAPGGPSIGNPGGAGLSGTASATNF